MKNRKVIWCSLLAVLLLGAVAGIIYIFSYTSNPWNAKSVGEIPPPIGYTRIEAPTGSFAAFARALPLKKRGAKMHLYTGGEADKQSISTGVIDLPLLSYFEQCADVTMRLRAEYFFNQGRYSEISFTDVNGEHLKYNGGNSRMAFEMYMCYVYCWCSTSSLYNETSPRKASEVQPGDVLVYSARPGEKYGHALIIIDVARNISGDVAVMCAEGNTPARDIHVLRNYNPFRNPWFVIDDDDDTFRIHTYYFKKDELRHY